MKLCALPNLSKALVAAIVFAAFGLSISSTAKATTFPDLGQAANFAVFSLDGTVNNLSNVTVNGNVGVGPNGDLKLMAPSTVNGTVFRDPSSTISANAGTATGGFQVTSLSQAVTDAQNASTAFAALTPTVTLGNITTATTINRTGVDTVINLSGGITLNNANLTLNGGAGDSFVLNIQGGLSLVGTAALTLTGGVLPQNVFYNFLGTGTTLATHVGDSVIGVVLAVQRDINFDGSFIGEIIGGGSQLSLLSGATVTTVIPEVPAFAPLAGVFVLVIGLSHLRRRQRATV